MEDLMNKMVEKCVFYAPKVLLVFVVLFVGLKVIGLVSSLLNKLMEKKNIDVTLRPFVMSLLNALLKVALALTVAGMVGIETTSFVAILGAAGFAVGMALQGSLGNFAGGALIMIFKPFKVGDVITAQGYTGSVKEIQIFCTIMKTPDNKTIIVPNGPLAGGSLINFSTEKTRRVDWTFGIGYDDDFRKAQKILLDILAEDSRVFSDPVPFVKVGELADSSVNFTVRAWANASDYWNIYFDMNEKVKETFDRENISIPYPQQDVHMHEVKK